MYALCNLISAGELMSESTIKDPATGRLTTMEKRTGLELFACTFRYSKPVKKPVMRQANQSCWRKICTAIGAGQSRQRARTYNTTNIEGRIRGMAEIDKTLLQHDSALRDVYRKFLPLLQPPPEPPKRRIGFNADNP